MEFSTYTKGLTPSTLHTPCREEALAVYMVKILCILSMQGGKSLSIHLVIAFVLVSALQTPHSWAYHRMSLGLLFCIECCYCSNVADYICFKNSKTFTMPYKGNSAKDSPHHTPYTHHVACSISATMCILKLHDGRLLHHHVSMGGCWLLYLHEFICLFPQPACEKRGIWLGLWKFIYTCQYAFANRLINFPLLAMEGGVVLLPFQTATWEGGEPYTVKLHWLKVLLLFFI